MTMLGSILHDPKMDYQCVLRLHHRRPVMWTPYALPESDLVLVTRSLPGGGGSEEAVASLTTSVSGEGAGKTYAVMAMA